MGDVEDRPREELGPGIPERALQRRVHTLEVSVEADDAQQVDGEVEELLQLDLGLRHIWRHVHNDALLRCQQYAEGGRRRWGAAPGLPMRVSPRARAQPSHSDALTDAEQVALAVSEPRPTLPRGALAGVVADDVGDPIHGPQTGQVDVLERDAAGLLRRDGGFDVVHLPPIWVKVPGDAPVEAK